MRNRFAFFFRVGLWLLVSFRCKREVPKVPPSRGPEKASGPAFAKCLNTVPHVVSFTAACPPGQVLESCGKEKQLGGLRATPLYVMMVIYGVTRAFLWLCASSLGAVAPPPDVAHVGGETEREKLQRRPQKAQVLCPRSPSMSSHRPKRTVEGGGAMMSPFLPVVDLGQ